MGVDALGKQKSALKFYSRLFLGVWAGCAGLAYSSVAATDLPIKYDVVLSVPQAQRELLEKHLNLYRWRNSERMDEDQLRNLVNQAPDNIRDLLATEGYYSPAVTADLTQINGSWIVNLAVKPGEPVRVGLVDLGVTGPIDDVSPDSQTRLEKIRAEWSLPAGAIFRHADWETAKRAALRGLLLDRYPAAVVSESQAAINPEKKTADLSLKLDSGPAFTFGSLQIDGLRRYPASIVERLSPIRQGETYTQARLLELQSRLQDSPYFASASVQVNPDREHPDKVPIKVEVVENKARTLGLGVGYSTDIGPRGQVDYRDLNLMGLALRFSANLKLAQKEQTLGSELHFPQTALGYRNSLAANFKRTDVEGEITRTLALGARRSHLQGKNETAYSLHLFHEQQDIQGAPGDRRTALVPSWSWTRRDVDSLLFPTRGYLINVQADAAAEALLSDRSFLRGYGRANWFHPIGQQGQLILRGELGMVAADSRDGIPSDFLFRTGGDQTVRGYAYQSLGVAEGDAIVGGRSLAVVSGEYVYWFKPKWGVAAFVDAGDAADSIDELNLNLGYGLGARWKSPVGPLSLDVAHGRETEETRLHFSAGFSF